jgi:hypothetical protein
MTTSKRNQASREALAGSLALKLRGAACAGRAELWNAGEAQLRACSGPDRDGPAVAIMRLCEGCPVLQVCGQWARAEGYTGFAAGTTWVNGRAGVALPAERVTFAPVDAIGA